MSLILDALRKSQRTRQRQAGPATVAVETAGRQVQPHNWWAMVIAIVVLNLVVVAGFAWYISREQRATVTITQPATDTRTASINDKFATGNVAESSNAMARNGATPDASQDRTVRPLSAEVRTPARVSSADAEAPAAKPASVPPPQPPGSAIVLPSEAEQAGFLPTLAELQLEQRIQLSPLHVDVHVYNQNPQRRFVLINAAKYKEGERLKEGPLLEEIRSDGLVMYYRGQRFLLPRN